MTATITPDKTLFESKYCGRCGGSGKYSFNLMNGDRCFGCHGSGVQLTARGKAAKAFYVESQKMPVSELKPGMFLFDNEVNKFVPIIEIRAEPCGWMVVGGERIPLIGFETRRGTFGLTSTSVVRAVRDEEHRKAQVAAALAHQATLTKQGKPAKRIAA